MARKKQKPDALLALALAPFAGALVATRTKQAVKIIGGSGGVGGYVAPRYWPWEKGHPLLFCGVESETQSRGGRCRGWLKVITPMGFGWVSPSAATQLDLVSDVSPRDLSPLPIP